MAFKWLEDVRFSNLLLKIPSEEKAIEFCEDFGLIPTQEDFLKIESHERRADKYSSRRQSNICDGKLRIDQSSHYKIGWYARCAKIKDKAKNQFVGCDQQFNPLMNTWFERSKLPVLALLHLTLAFVFRTSITIGFVMNDLMLAEETITNWFHYCRAVCREFVIDRSQKIGGPGMIVQIGLL